MSNHTTNPVPVLHNCTHMTTHAFGTVYREDFPNGFSASVLVRSSDGVYECAVMSKRNGSLALDPNTALGDISDVSALYAANMFIAKVASLTPAGHLPASVDDPHDPQKWWDK